MSNRTQGKRWCFTSFKPQDQLPKWVPELMDFMIFQREKAPDTGREHWQGFIVMKNKKTLPTVKRVLDDNEVHLETTRGSVQQNIDYCSKDDTCVDTSLRHEYGSRPAEHTAGLKHNLWEKLEEDVKAGKSYDEIINNNFKICVMNSNGVNRAIQHFSKPPARRTVVNLCIWGETGVGKTNWIYDTFNPDDVYFLGKHGWWDGYEGQKVVVYDDFYGNFKVSEMLNLLDIYRHQVQIKGGMTYIRPEFNILTSNDHPDDWYKNLPLNVKNALRRRLPNENIHHAQVQGDIPKLQDWNYTPLRPASDASDGPGNTDQAVVRTE